MCGIVCYLAQYFLILDILTYVYIRKIIIDDRTMNFEIIYQEKIMYSCIFIYININEQLA